MISIAAGVLVKGTFAFAKNENVAATHRAARTNNVVGPALTLAVRTDAARPLDRLIPYVWARLATVLSWPAGNWAWLRRLERWRSRRLGLEMSVF